MIELTDKLKPVLDRVFDSVVDTGRVDGDIYAVPMSQSRPIVDIGRNAVGTVVSLARGESLVTKRVELATHLVVRKSTAPPAAGAAPITEPEPPTRPEESPTGPA